MRIISFPRNLLSYFMHHFSIYMILDLHKSAEKLILSCFDWKIDQDVIKICIYLKI